MLAVEHQVRGVEGNCTRGGEGAHAKAADYCGGEHTGEEGWNPFHGETSLLIYEWVELFEIF